MNRGGTPRRNDPRKSLLVYGAGRNQLPLLAAGRRRGWRIIAIDRDAGAPGRSLADRFLCLSLRDHEAIVKELASEKIVGVVARITDHVGLESACRIARDQGLASVCPGLFAAATHKTALARQCRRAGLRTPERRSASDPDLFEKGPILLRPDVTIRGKAGIRRVRSVEALELALPETRSRSGNGEVDLADWIDGTDVSILVQLDRGHGRRLALWDEWVALDAEGMIRGVGCGMPSVFEEDPTSIDRVIDRLARAFPESRGLIALSLRIDAANRPWMIEIHLGIGGDGIADRLLPAALPGFDAFELLARTQAGERVDPPPARARPRALLRDGEGGAWRIVEARDAATLRARCLASLPRDWEAPRGLLPGTKP